MIYQQVRTFISFNSKLGYSVRTFVILARRKLELKSGQSEFPNSNQVLSKECTLS
jgi:hypothetical protein